MKFDGAPFYPYFRVVFVDSRPTPEVLRRLSEAIGGSFEVDEKAKFDKVSRWRCFVFGLSMSVLLDRQWAGLGAVYRFGTSCRCFFEGAPEVEMAFLARSLLRQAGCGRVLSLADLAAVSQERASARSLFSEDVAGNDDSQAFGMRFRVGFSYDGADEEVLTSLMEVVGCTFGDREPSDGLGWRAQGQVLGMNVQVASVAMESDVDLDGAGASTRRPGHYVFEGSPEPSFLPPNGEVEDISFLAQAVLESVEGVSITKDSP